MSCMVWVPYATRTVDGLTSHIETGVEVLTVAGRLRGHYWLRERVGAGVVAQRRADSQQHALRLARDLVTLWETEVTPATIEPPGVCLDHVYAVVDAALVRAGIDVESQPELAYQAVREAARHATNNRVLVERVLARYRDLQHHQGVAA